MDSDNRLNELAKLASRSGPYVRGALMVSGGALVARTAAGAPEGYLDILMWIAITAIVVGFILIYRTRGNGAGAGQLLFV